MSVKNKNCQILIVDDEPLIRQSLFEILRIEGYSVHIAESAEEALGALSKAPAHIVVTDFKLPQMNGIELLCKIKSLYHDTEVILMTGFGSIETAVDAMKKGAFDYITKPIDDTAIKIIIKKIIEKKENLKENTVMGDKPGLKIQDSFHNMIGVSPKMQSVYDIIDSVASTNATILIEGESGTGKSLAAKAIHKADQNRKNKPFIEINCGALTETLLESELFGHVKGAFTGAIKDKEGRFEYAKGGTIFLDEIDAFSPSLQVKLLRVLQDGVFERVGDNQSRKADARIIVATNRNLLELVQEGDFREDLYYRVNVISIRMPPLRERTEDIEMLAMYYIGESNKANAKFIQGMSDEVKNAFMSYYWPGNIRELENTLEGAVIMAKSNQIELATIPSAAKFSPTAVSNFSNLSAVESNNLKKAVEEPEKEHIIAVLKECDWNRNKAAALLGVNRTTLYNKMKKYNIKQD